MDTPLAEHPPFRFLLPRQALLLGLMMLSLALVSVWMLLPSHFLWAGTVHSSLLPQVLSGVLILLLALMTPFLCGAQYEHEPLRQRLIRMGYVSIWVAVMAFFGLLVASRLAPLETMTLFKVTALLTFLTLTLQLLAATFTQAYTGIVFVWMVAMPVSAYFMAETFLMSPAGGRGWQEHTPLVALNVGEEQAHVLHETVRWLLNLSPGTLIVGILNGAQVDGSLIQGVQWAGVLTVFAAGCLLCILVLSRRKSLQTYDKLGTMGTM